MRTELPRRGNTDANHNDVLDDMHLVLVVCGLSLGKVTMVEQESSKLGSRLLIVPTVYCTV